MSKSYSFAPDAISSRFDKYKEVGVILAGIDLPLDPTDYRFIGTDKNEEVFGVESTLLVRIYNLDVREMLRICTDFILAFDNEDTV